MELPEEIERLAQISAAGQDLYEEENTKGEMTYGERRRRTIEIVRTHGLTIEQPGSEGRPNATVEAIISAAQSLRLANGH